MEALKGTTQSSLSPLGLEAGADAAGRGECRAQCFQSQTPPNTGARLRPSGNPLRWCVAVCLVLAGYQAPTEAAELAEDSALEILGPDVEDLSWTPGLSPDAPVAELEEMYARRRGYFKVPLISDGLDYAYDRRNDLDDKLGLRIGAAYTMLFQGLSGGPWDQYGGAGDFDLFTSWTAIGRGTENTGRFVFDLEERFGIGDRTPSSLGRQIATLQPTANAFNDRGFVIRDLFWAQRLYDGQLRFIIGRADSTDYFGSTWMQSPNNSFVNRMFAANPTIVAPGHGPATGLSYRPNDYDFYVSAGAANAYGTTTTSGFSSLEETTFFCWGEAGWTPTFETLGQGRYTFSGWHMGERDVDGIPADWGVSLVADQQISETVQVFARWGYADGAVANIKNYLQGGAGFRGLMGDPGDMAGIAFSHAFPSDSASEQEKVLEGFYRWQLTRFSQVSVGAQAIFDPGNGPDHDVVGAFWGRLRIVF
ncbi:MAG: carbohydrate porin [Verrucomicrobia bacterium]|nr:carbohydrate porin [Verrucomicrobiota bacterium]